MLINFPAISTATTFGYISAFNNLSSKEWLVPNFRHILMFIPLNQPLYWKSFNFDFGALAMPTTFTNHLTHCISHAVCAHTCACSLPFVVWPSEPLHYSNQYHPHNQPWTSRFNIISHIAVATHVTLHYVLFELCNATSTIYKARKFLHL